MEFDDKARVGGVNIEDRRPTIIDMIIDMLTKAAEQKPQGNGLDDIEDENTADPIPPPPPVDEPGPMPEIRMPNLSPIKKPADDNFLGAVKRRIGRFF